jgi:hypothetical protein
VREPEDMDQFEQQLQRAMRRVEPRAETAAKFMAIAGDVRNEQKVSWFQRKLGWAFVMPRPQVWATAALLAVGVLVGEQAHVRNEARKEADARQQFEAAARVTDRALEHAREQLERAGLVLGN